MKKLFKDNYITKRKVLEFLDKKGFYLVLFLCISVITITAYIVTKKNLSSYMDNPSFDISSNNVGTVDSTISTNNSAKPDKNIKEAEDKTNNLEKNSVVIPKSSTNNEKSKPSVQQPKTNNVKEPDEPKLQYNMQLPVQGDIIQDYAKNSLIYSKTLEQWTTHEGLDIASDRGVPVKASFEGTVVDVYNDYKYGISIVIDHGSGIRTKYCNLSTDSMVKKGMKVKKGDVISGVGNTAMFESGEQPHVHFEVIQNGVSVNPKNFIK